MQDESRRKFIKSGLAAGATGLAFGSLAARANNGLALGRSLGRGKEAFGADYGPLSPKQDMATGLYLLALPESFEYMSFGWTGQTVNDGSDVDGPDNVAISPRGGIVVCEDGGSDAIRGPWKNGTL